MFFPPATSFSTAFQFGTGSPVGSIFAPVVSTTNNNFCVGHLAQAGAGPASGFTLTAQLNSGDDPTNLLAAPTGFSLIWQYPAPGAPAPANPATARTVSIWAPTTAVGFVALGMVGRSEAYVGAGNLATPPPTPSVTCVAVDQLVTAEVGALIWFYGGGSAPVWLYSMPTSGLFLATTGAPPAQGWVPAPATLSSTARASRRPWAGFARLRRRVAGLKSPS